MLGVEDVLEGVEDNERGDILQPRKGKKKSNGDCHGVGSLRNIMMNAELQKCMIAMVEAMKVDNPGRVS